LQIVSERINTFFGLTSKNVLRRLRRFEIRFIST
jgi:hypothetical protein